jgi:hypothetical protein
MRVVLISDILGNLDIEAIKVVSLESGMPCAALCAQDWCIG